MVIKASVFDRGGTFITAAIRTLRRAARERAWSSELRSTHQTISLCPLSVCQTD